MTTVYDLVEYPTTVHLAAHPDRLAVAARLAGLDPAPVPSARVLEIGGGSCLGLINFAATYPGSTCHGFDLAESAIAHGQRLAGQACPNLTLAVDDIMTAKDRFAPGSFDYVVAHGVYSWVPLPVREALLDLVAHVLSPHGVAFISYNAMPGGHIRQILRNMLLHAISEADGAEARIEATKQALALYAEPREGDDALMQGLRHHARLMQARPAALVFHDELGDCFEPQALGDVVAAAGAHGLRFLTDGGPNRAYDGFLPRDEGEVADPDAEVVRLAQMRDYMEMCWFRITLLVRAEAPLSRRLDPARAAGLWVSTRLKPLENDEFEANGNIIGVPNPELAAALRDLAAIWPGRRPVADLARTPDDLQVLMLLHRPWQVQFHTVPAPFVIEPGPRPATGRWMRDMLARDENELVSLAHRDTRIDQAEVRALLVAADGSRDLAQLAALDTGIPAAEVEAVLRQAAQNALLEA